MIEVMEFVALLRDELKLAITADDLAEDLDTLPGWDSVHLVALIGLLEQRTGRRLPLPSVLEAPTLESIHKLLAEADPIDRTPGPQQSPPQPTATATVTVAITGHGTMASLLPALDGELARHGLALNAVMTGFDSYVFELGNPGSRLYAADPDLALCLLDPMMVFDAVGLPWSPADVEQAFAALLARLEDLAGRFAATARGTLVLNTIPLPYRFAAQLVDRRSRAALGASWREGNARLLRLAQRHPAVVVVDLDPLLAQGIAAGDSRLSIYAKAHLSEPLLAAYARDVAHLARHLLGRTRKCLVVDLDETLWGGVLGDDGFTGIELGDGYRGEAFGAFQRVLKQLHAQGVLLAAVSKNELEPVRQVVREHPGMVLREAEFVRITANWRPKPENLTELAADLNLGPDSFVFADDSAFECALVGRQLPGVAVIRLDDDPAARVEQVLADGWFDVRELTAEDHARTSRYREELVRQDFQRGFSSIADFLRELDIRVRLASAAEADVSRVSQLTLRTNQFNLTTRRLSPADVRDLMADPESLVLVVESADRFGGNGSVGALFARRSGDVLEIDNFVLSCRVFSRGIEQACLVTLLHHARRTGARVVRGRYRPSPKNGIVRDFFPHNGFAALPSTGDTEAIFEHDLANIEAPPEHIRLTAELPREPLQREHHR